MEIRGKHEAHIQIFRPSPVFATRRMDSRLDRVAPILAQNFIPSVYLYAYSPPIIYILLRGRSRLPAAISRRPFSQPTLFPREYIISRKVFARRLFSRLLSSICWGNRLSFDHLRSTCVRWFRGYIAVPGGKCVLMEVFSYRRSTISRIFPISTMAYNPRTRFSNIISSRKRLTAFTKICWNTRCYRIGWASSKKVFIMDLL